MMISPIYGLFLCFSGLYCVLFSLSHLSFVLKLTEAETETPIAPGFHNRELSFSGEYLNVCPNKESKSRRGCEGV